MSLRPRIVVLALAGALAAAGPARALNFFELEVYPATTEGKGLHEIENTTTFVANGHEAPEHRLLRSSVEYDYGLTDRIDVRTQQLDARLANRSRDARAAKGHH